MNEQEVTFFDVSGGVSQLMDACISVKNLTYLIY
jgi:hypothetical protein